MKCFIHPDTDAVGSCKHCFKGVCADCAKDTGVGNVCSAACEEEVKAIRAMVERNRRVHPLAAKTHTRNAIWFTILAWMLIVFALVAQHGSLSSYLIVFGTVMLLGAAFSAFISRRMSRLYTANASDWPPVTRRLKISDASSGFRPRQFVTLKTIFHETK